MHYLIDGYNLLFRILKAGDSLHSQRGEVTSYLEKRLGAIGVNATLIFDSHYREDEGSRGHLRSLEIVFTAHKESADAHILRFLRESHSPENFTVVTSDKTLARLCRMKLAKTESIDEFLSFINKRYRNKMKQDTQPDTTEIKIAPTPPPPPPSKEPDPHASAESCFDYYLRLFEEASPPPEDLSSKKPPKIEPEKMKLKKLLKPKEPPLSDEERWLKAFERNESAT